MVGCLTKHTRHPGPWPHPVGHRPPAEARETNSDAHRRPQGYSCCSLKIHEGTTEQTEAQRKCIANIYWDSDQKHR